MVQTVDTLEAANQPDTPIDSIDSIEEIVEEEEEALLSLTLPQEPHFKVAATEAVAKESNKRQEKKKPCRAKAKV